MTEESLADYITRLEQENNTNEKQIELDVEHICRLNEQIEKLQQENKELKEENANLKSLTWYIYCCGEVETIDCIITEYYESRKTQYEKGFWKKVCTLKNAPYQSKYKSTLEEIKEYITRHPAPRKDRVLNIINEVLE